MSRQRRKQHRNRIAELREARGMREVDLALACDPPVSNASVISRLETGILSLTQDWCYRLAPPLSCRPWDFFPEIVEMPIAEQITALWVQLDPVARVELLPRLLADEPPRISFKRASDDDHAGKLVDFEVRDDGVFNATFYYRRR
jgi:hypothetical protein